MPPQYGTNHREIAKQFLAASRAREVSRMEFNTWRSVHYEMDVVDDDAKVVIEVWIENESKLEEPEYYYNLRRFDGDPK